MNVANLKKYSRGIQFVRLFIPLIGDSGVMIPNVVAAGGHDLRFGTSLLGHFCFTKLVLILLSTAKSSSDDTVRIINTARPTDNWFGVLKYHSMKDGLARRN